MPTMLALKPWVRDQCFVLHLCINVCMHLCVCLCVRACVYVCVHLCVFVRACIHVCVSVSRLHFFLPLAGLAMRAGSIWSGARPRSDRKSTRLHYSHTCI